MPRLLKQRSKKAGLPPGSLVHIGETKAGEPSITVIDYDESGFREMSVGSLDQCLAFKDKPAVTWINVDCLKPEIIRAIGDCYGFHPLVLEDILNTDQRPKLEDYGNYLYIVLKMIHNGKKSEFVTEQISLIVGRNYVLSFQEGIEGDVFSHVRERIKNGRGRMRSTGSDYLAYSLIDAIVDSYFAVIEKVGERIEEIEDELIKYPSKATLHAIHELKREMIFLRKAVWPLREVITGMERIESELIKENTVVYLRDVYDHTIQVIETIEISREMLSGMLDIYLSSISNRMNEVMKLLTIIGTIFLPLTFIVGIYGMNFDVMPELRWRYGYLGVWVIMAATTGLMLFYFRKKKWL